ncbi:MAG: hydroxymethylbilane synthase [Planctomycetota bacterium]
MKLRLATRKSKLALWQAEETRARICAARPDFEVELVKVESTGDRDQATDLARFGRIGIFTVEVDRTLQEGRADIGVHSLKDLTTELVEGIVLGGVLPRGPVADALISRGDHTLGTLPKGARVATGSMRRRAMLLAARPDLDVVEIRGNVDTRLAKLKAGDADAIVLAQAGLVRLGLDEHITELLDLPHFLSAVGQGIVGLTTRADNREVRKLLSNISDQESHHEALAERALLAGLRGGCNVPVGALARVREGALSLRARVLSLDGTECVEAEISGSRDHAKELGRMLSTDLNERGADRLIAEARQ